MSLELCTAILNSGVSLAYKKNMNRSKEFCEYVASLISKEDIDLNQLSNWKDYQWETFFNVLLKIYIENSFKPGSTPLLVHALRNTADGVQNFLDTKKVSQAPKFKSICEAKLNLSLMLVINIEDYDVYLKEIRSKICCLETETLKNKKLYIWVSGKNTSKDMLNTLAYSEISSFYVDYNLANAKDLNSGFSALASCFKNHILKMEMNNNYKDYSTFVNEYILENYKKSIYPPITFSRAGIKNNYRKTSFSRISYEAARISYINEALKQKDNKIDLVSCLLFGLPLKVGTGYKFKKKYTLKDCI